MVMNRRRFILDSAWGGLLAAVRPHRAEALPQASSPPGVDLEEITTAELQQGMASGRFTSRAVTEAYFARIDALDRNGPALRSIIEVNPEALDVATALDAERKSKGARGPLHGVPVLLKDNVDTHDKMTTTAGSLALEGSIPLQDSTVAAKLRAAGAVLLAKANLSEWANIRSGHSSSGWSARGGQCRNPYVLDRNPCGSSSGSGTATSANLGAISIGTETDGSIVCPSNACGLVGFKPTVGLVSRAGIIPISHTQDTAGPMTRTVTDAAMVLGVIAGRDSRDPATAAGVGKSHTDYTQFLDRDGLRGARLGVARQLFGFSPKVDRVLEEALSVLSKAGAVLVDPVTLPKKDDLESSEMHVLLYELKTDLNAYLATLGEKAPVKSLTEIIRFNETHRDREMPFFGQDLFIQADEKGPLTTPEYLEALAKGHRLTRDEGIDAAMGQHNLDAIVAPTGGPAWITDHVNGDHFMGGSSSFAAIAGYPNVTVPAGYVSGLPVGLSFFGRAWSEPSLFKIAYGFEQATKHRRPPRFLPTIET
jgi:amidase